MDSSILQKLIEKKDPLKEDKQAFSQEINRILKEEGLTLELVPYLSYAVKCDSIKNIIVWNNSLPSENQISNAQKIVDMINNSSIGNGDRFRIYMNLLVYQLNRLNANNEVIKTLLSYVVDTSYNTKKTKRLSDIGKIFKSAFVDKMDENIKIPSLTSLYPDNYSYVCRLAELFGEMISDLDNSITLKSKEQEKKCKQLLKDWLKEQQINDSEKNSIVAEKSADTNVADKQKSAASTEIAEATLKDASETMPKPTERVFKTLYAKQLYDLAIRIEESEQIKRDIEKELREKRYDLSNIRKEYDELKRKYSGKSTECLSKDNTISELEKQIREMNNKIKEMSDKITRQAETMGTIKDSQGRETSEKLNNIASSLKRFYVDYQLSVGMEMTIDLGETMRDMVEDIFKKLEKCGIDIKGR